MTIDDPWSVLTADQARVARTFLAARQAEHHHLVIYLSGAHAYGFPSPDSDLDLKCIHIAPTRKLLGLTPSTDPGDRIEVVEGVELDYGSNELTGALRGAIKGNGNFLERFLGNLVLGGDADLLTEARAVVAPVLSRRVARHYGGFATSQLKLFDARPTAKRALYVLRTAATGRCLLARGQVVTDVAHLADFVPREIEELVTIKRRGEQQPLSAEHAQTWRARLEAAIAAVDLAVPSSVLPADPPAAAVEALEDWLVDVRRRR
jgi:uncharacterized protein